VVSDYAQFGFSIFSAQGDLIYLHCRATRATHVVEFATSVGFSTLYLATAVRDDGGGPIDGWPLASGASLARQVIETVAPQLRLGAFVMNDNGEEDYMAFIRDPRNGFSSRTLPIKRGTQLSVKLRI
jgi:hypothetical protein